MTYDIKGTFHFVGRLNGRTSLGISMFTLIGATLRSESLTTLLLGSCSIVRLVCSNETGYGA